MANEEEEEELTFAQMLALVKRKGIAESLPKDADDATAKLDTDDAIELMAQPQSIALVLGDIDDNDDHIITRKELGKFYRELAALLKHKNTLDANDNIIKGTPLQPEIDAFLDKIRKTPAASVYQKRFDEAPSAEEKEAVKHAYEKDALPQATLEGILYTATALIEIRVSASQTIAALPKVVALMAEQMSSPESAADLKNAYAQIAMYSFELKDGHIAAPTIEEVFPNVMKAAPVDTPKGNGRPR